MSQVLYDEGSSHAAVKQKAGQAVSPIADFWFNLLEAADVQGKAVMEWSAPFWDPRLLQKKWLEALSHTMDGYLRSTAFLEFMRQCTKTSAPGDSNETAVVPHHEIIEGDPHR